MECVVVLGAIVGIVLALYFHSRLATLEKKARQVDTLTQQIDELRAQLGLHSPHAIDVIPPPTTSAVAAKREAAALPPAATPAALPPTPALAATPAARPTPPAQPLGLSQVQLSTKAAPAAQPHTGPVPVAAPVAEASGPSLMDRIPESPLWRWFMGSHMVVRVGIIILFIGVAFLLKYAADQGWLSIELRLASAAVLGVALVYTGWRLRAKQRIYALTLQGGGLGIAYLTTFAAFRIYELLPAPLAFGLLVAIGIVCGALAVLNDAKALALPAIIGGFAAPFLVSTGQGSHVTLFSYFTLLNAAILLIAWYKSWRELNLVGFLFTFVLATLWGWEFYQPDYFTTVEPFLILFFAFYVAIGLLFTLRQPPRLVGLIDGPIVFGTPVIVMAWQSLLVRNTEYGLAWSAAAMGVLYLLLFVVLARASANFATLRQSYLAISTVALTLAVPFAVDARLTSAIWAVAGVGIVWAGLRQSRRFHVLWGGLIQLGAAAFYMSQVVDGLVRSRVLTETRWLGFLDSTVVSGVLIAVAALLTGYLTLAALRREKRLLVAGDYSLISWGATLWGLAWWYGTGIYAIATYVMAGPGTDAPASFSTRFNSTFLWYACFFVLSAAVGEWLGGRFQWRAVRLTSLLLWAVIGITALVHVTIAGPLLVGWGWLVWPAAVVVHYWMLRRLEPVNGLRFYHALGFWLLAWLPLLDLIIRDFTWHDNTLWDIIIVLTVPVVLTLLISLFGKRLPWPTGQYYTHYMTLGVAPLIFMLLVFSVVHNFSHNGESTHFAYLPLLNPVSIVHLIVLGTLAVWAVQLQKAVAAPSGLRPVWFVWAILFFIWFNADVARIVHHFWGVPFRFEALLQSSLLQAVYSIIWTLLAMGLMYTGTRLARRWLWLVGATLLAITVLKLLVLDLAAADTLARIVSFIVVGLLMLLIGYFSPIPPAAQKPVAVTAPPDAS